MGQEAKERASRLKEEMEKLKSNTEQMSEAMGEHEREEPVLETLPVRSVTQERRQRRRQHSSDTLKVFRGSGTVDQVWNLVHLERVFSMTLPSHQMEPDLTTGWWVGSAVFSASLGAYSMP